ncbi:S8 family peptidase [Idiomarina sp. HB]|uniref:S8 family peptidase n=1 Tax=Idiomarina sp. HB TaxID=3110479 RepID=UPI003A803411
MADRDSKPHLYIGNDGVSHLIHRKSPRQKPPVRAINRGQHGGNLSSYLNDIKAFEHEVKLAPLAEEVERIGLQVTFESFDGFEIVFDSLSNAPAGIELLNIQRRDNKYYATVFIPEGKLVVFQKKIEQYIATSSDETPKNRPLIESIEAFYRATIKALWTDSVELFPSNNDEPVNWEIWLLKSDGTPERDFRHLAKLLEIEVLPGVLRFRERVVIYVNASTNDLMSNIHLLNTIAELRKPKETAEFFDHLMIQEQREWADELLERVQSFPNEDAPIISILDTGVNIGHQLIAPFSSQDQLFTVNEAIGTADTDGHGTNMAGLAIWGDLKEALESTSTISISHNIESVKIINSGGDNRDQAYGAITIDATTASATSRPQSTRIFTMAISATDTRDMGRPSAWSAAIDELCFNRIGDQDPKRLFIISAGNSILQPADFKGYPDCLESQPIHDPGQSWNAITIGAYTQKVGISDPSEGGALASFDEISPYSSTSVVWGDKQPIKPDVVFEGGNVAVSELGGFTHPSLSLLTTDHDIQNRLFTTFWATSAATALAAEFAAKVCVKYPRFRPETIRALMVHSASWTEAQYKQFAPTGTAKQKSSKLIRRVGYGVPNIERALESASQRVSVVIEDEIVPYKKDPSVKLNEMKLHDLPWPKEILQSLGNIEVTLTVTLSYFIEPNPSNRAFSNKYSYQSHNLGFELKRALESVDDLLQGINTGTRPKTFQRPDDTGDWIIGPQKRAHGSIAKDIWVGTAVDLASRDKIAVIPTAGWWKTRESLRMYDESTRYSLILTIEAPETEVDIYAAIKNIIETGVETPVDVSI